jgi:hypothetical protein
LARQAFLEAPQAFLKPYGVSVDATTVARSMPPGREGLGVNAVVAINYGVYFNVVADVVAAYAVVVVCQWGFWGCYIRNESIGIEQSWDGAVSYPV